MTGTELTVEVRELLDEPSAETNYYTDARLLAWLNKEYYSLVRKTGFLMARTNVTKTGGYYNDVDSIANSPIHYMPTDFMRISDVGGVWWAESSTNLIKLKPIDKVQFNTESGSFNSINVAGTPVYYNVSYYDRTDAADLSKSGKRIEVYPYPNAIGNKLQAWYVTLPAAIEAATSPILDEDYQWALIYGAAATGKLKKRLLDEKQMFELERDKLIHELKAELFNRAKDENATQTDVYRPYRS